MSLWSAMNWVAWGLCAFLFFVIARDFIQVERDRMAEKKKGQK